MLCWESLLWPDNKIKQEQSSFIKAVFMSVMVLKTSKHLKSLNFYLFHRLLLMQNICF